jgi:hypothetical protein
MCIIPALQPVIYKCLYLGTYHSSEQCCGSWMLIPDPGSKFSIPDPGSKRSRIRIRSKNLCIFNPILFLPSSQKYDPECSSRIPDPDQDFSPSRIRIPDSGVKNERDPESRIRIRNTSSEVVLVHRGQRLEKRPCLNLDQIS